jgi:hypothetical protein
MLFDALLWCMWFSVTLGIGLMLYVRERRRHAPDHNSDTCQVCAQFRHDQYSSSFRQKLRVIKGGKLGE